MRLLMIFYLFILLLSCKSKNETGELIGIEIETGIRSQSYLALGDSYTIGTSVAAQESFPYQLVDSLKKEQINLSSIKVIAQNGWTTTDLLQAIEREKLQNKYKFVTLLIGVNNQFRGGSKQVYENEFKVLLETAINFAGGNKKHVFVLSIPDYAVTPFGRNNTEISKEIDEFNAINKRITEQTGCYYLDITPISRLAKNDIALIAQDGLHPSAKMYAMWVFELKKQMLKQISSE